jgi:cell division septation protein DedD
VPTATPDPANCTNLLLNGDFELGTGWSFGSTPYPARYVTAPVYSGLRAVSQGLPSGVTNRVAHSSAFQKVFIPADAPAPVVLRFARYSGGAADGVDYRETLLLNTSYGYLASLERSKAAGDEKWVERTFDLTAYRGRTLVVYFNVYNNGKGTQMWNAIDKVSLGSCANAAALVGEDGRPLPAPAVDPDLSDYRVYLPDVRQEEDPTPAAEPTPAVEPTAAPTAESTPAPTAEPTAEPTAGSTPAPTAEPTAEPTAAPTATRTATP